jgi:hypothetical protein
MDSTALHELIAQVRGTTAALAEAEQRVASFTAELAPAGPGSPIRRQTRSADSDAHCKTSQLGLGAGRLPRSAAAMTRVAQSDDRRGAGAV